MDLSVSNVRRTITLSVEPGEAQVAVDWLTAARSMFAHYGATVPGGGSDPPFLLSQLRGALAAVAQGRDYGGH
jgi:hypothetical protein